MNKKTLFLVITLVAMLILVTSVNAATDNTNTSTTHSISEKTTTAEPVVKEKIEKSATKELKTDKTQTKQITKTNKTRENTKKDSIIINGIEYTNIIENQIISEEEIYFENENVLLNNCTVNGEIIIFDCCESYINSSTINVLFANGGGRSILNNSILTGGICNEGDICDLYIYNSTLNGVQLENYENGNIWIDVNTIIINSEIIKNKGNIHSNSSYNFNGYETNTKTVEVNDYNELITQINEATDDDSNENWIINLNEGIYNTTSNVNFDHSSPITKTIKINGNGQTLTAKALTGNRPTFVSFCQNNLTKIIIENTKIDHTLRNYGNMEIINTTLNNNIRNYGNLTIHDDVNYGESYKLEINEGNITYKGSTPTNPYDGNNEINNENITIEVTIPVTGNITLTNCQINAKITNKGNLTLVNSTLSEQGMIINENGNISFVNSTISSNITNNGIVTFVNSTLSSSGRIINNGTVIIDDKCIVDENFYISPEGHIVANETVGAYLNVLEGNYTFENMNFTKGKINKGNVTFINCNLTSFSNIGNATLINCSFKDNVNGYCKITGEWGHGEAVGTACLHNTGTCIVDSCSFENNYAGYRGSAINNYGQITINNTLFHNNSGSQYGGALYLGSNANTSILNSNFTQNHLINYINTVDLLGGGCIYADSTYFTIDNCIFKDNYAYNNLTGIAGVEVCGATIASRNSNGSITNSYFENNTCENGVIINGYFGYGYRVQKGLINITNTTFTKHNEGRNIIYSEWSQGHYNLKENKFINNNNLNYIIEMHKDIGGTRNDNIIENITNNQFSNNKLKTNTINLGYANNTNTKDNTYKNTTLNDQLTLNIPEKIYTGEPLTITGTYTLDTKYYDKDILEKNQFQLYINGVLNQTQDTLEFNIIPTTGNMVLIVQPTISQTQKVETIRTTTLTDVIITPENYASYNYNGLLIGVTKDSKVIFQGEFTDKELSIQTNDIIIDGTQATFTNTTFTLEESGITLQNMKINNTQTGYVITNTKDNNKIIGNTITITNNNGKTAAIYNKANNTQITDNTLYVDGPAGDIDFNGDEICTTQAILLIGGNQNTIENNNITITSTSSSSSFGTIEGITNSINATNTIIKGNKLNVSGGMFNYAINTQKNVENITISDNNILVTGERYTNGIQAGNNATNILISNNTIKCICQNTTPLTTEGALTYGIITTKQAGEGSNNITITQNHITLTGTANYGMEIYTTNNTQITNNTIILTGTKSMGIGYAHSPNSIITGNTIQTNDDTTTPLNSITEELQPQNVGIKIQQDSENILITENTIQTYDKQGKDTCIDVNANNITVKDNNLTSSTKTGENTITTTQPDTILDNNNAIEQESTTQTTTEDLTIGDNTTLTAQFYDDTYTPVSGGKAIFRVNGKTLRDDQGNVIYADVINGRAELPDVNITQEWTKEDTTIQAVYIGDNNNEPIITTPTNVTVTKPEATITIDAPTEATSGTTITLKANVTDGGKELNSGRVAFKLNGKTLKDPKTGKALYAEVRDGVATITYTIPEKTKAKEYTLTGVFTDINYDRVEAESKLNVVKA